VIVHGNPEDGTEALVIAEVGLPDVAVSLSDNQKRLFVKALVFGIVNVPSPGKRLHERFDTIHRKLYRA
jgi:hypothetical protein